MSTMSVFLKQNKIVKENAFFAATTSLCDEMGEPLLWEIKPLTTREEEKIRDACTKNIPVSGKSGTQNSNLDSNAYLAKLIASSIVYPDLLDAELQDSYGVKTPEDLIKEMLDNFAEYMELVKFIQKFNGFDISMDEKIEEVKN